MSFANVDDNYPDHPKVFALSDAAFRLHTSAIIYCNRVLSDGLISASKVPTLVPRFKRSTLQELTDCNLWHFHRSIDTYEIHDFLDWNSSRAQVIANRERLSKAGRKGAERRWGLS